MDLDAVTNCDLIIKQTKSRFTSFRLHRTWRNNVGKCSKKWTGYKNEYSCSEGIHRIEKSSFAIQRIVWTTGTNKQHLGEHDAQLNGIYEAIENLLDDKVEKQTWENRKQIGFKN